MPVSEGRIYMTKNFDSTKQSNSVVPRRDFMKYLLAGSALSVGALEKLNAGVFQSIKELNIKHIRDEAPDGIYWDEIRKHFLLEGRLIMMNNGTVGPMPKPVFNTLMKTFRIQVSNPYDVYNFLPGKERNVLEKVAAFIGADPNEVALTRNTTEGMNFAANGIKLEPGDEILLSSMEHPGGTHPWRLKAKRYGVVIREVPIGLPPKNVDDFVRPFEAAIGPKTKVISISHTVYISGLISPLKELSEMAHKKGVLVMADAAHALGMLNLNMKDLGVDTLATSPYKWLGAPTGIGVFYVRKDVQDRIWPTIASSGWEAEGTAQKYETLGQRSVALNLALGEAVDFQQAIGKGRIERRIKALSGYLKRELSGIPGVKLHTSMDPYISGGLTAFSMEGVDPAKIVDFVREKFNIVVRTVGSKEKGTYGVRVSTPIYVGFRHVDMFLEGVKLLAKNA